MTDDQDTAQDGQLDETPADPQTRALLAIGTELSLIRQELTTLRQAVCQPPPAPDDDAGDGTDSDEWSCQFCDATFDNGGAARDHVVQEHNAPPQLWRDAIQEDHE